METKIEKGTIETTENIFMPKSSAARVLIPLLDALKWQGDTTKMLEAIVDGADEMDSDGLVETMANLNFKHKLIRGVKGKNIDTRVLPVLLVQGDVFRLVLGKDGKDLLVFDGEQGIYKHETSKHIKGDLYHFQYADDLYDSLVQPQSNWFGKLIYRFKNSLISLGILTLLMTALDLMLPLFVVLTYNRIVAFDSLKPLLLMFIGIGIYMMASFSLSHLRAWALNVISSRVGNIVMMQTYTRLMYLSPSYTETASINAQISRIRDFEGLKHFIANGNLISVFDLIFSLVYIVIIYVMGGWLGHIPVVTLMVLMFLGYLMKPFHKIKMEKVSEASSQRQQSLIEILKSVNEIKISGSKNNWMARMQKYTATYVLGKYDLSGYVNLTNNLSYFIANLSVLVMIYGGVKQVFEGAMTTGALIGILMLYWKIISSIRSVFSLTVQINGLVKSIGQINRFMNLPQDSRLKSSMLASQEIKGHVRFVDVSIRYSPTSNPALLNVSFEHSPGQVLGISGHDGAGKTTLLKLILGMYKPQAGRVILDNANIKQLEPLSLRQSICYSPDKDQLLAGTIRDNFRSYNPSITDKQIMELAERTELSRYFKVLGFGLDTHLSEEVIKEVSLSFKKLLNLTRMLARKGNLYLIDEPENHLNQDEILNIIAVIQDLAQNQKASVIVVTKDKTILNICNKVLYLNQGRVAERK